MTVGPLRVSKQMADLLVGQTAIAILAMPSSEVPGKGPADADTAVTYVMEDVYDMPIFWALAIADLVQHVANSFAHRGMDPQAVTRELWRVIDEERHRPTGKPEFLPGSR